MLGLERGDIQMLPLMTLPTELRRLKDSPQVNLTSKGYEGIGAINWLAFNLERKPLSDIKVRHAIAHAIDKKFITKALMGGFAVPADSPIVPGSPFFSDDIEPRAGPTATPGRPAPTARVSSSPSTTCRASTTSKRSLPSTCARN